MRGLVNCHDLVLSGYQLVSQEVSWNRYVSDTHSMPIAQLASNRLTRSDSYR